MTSAPSSNMYVRLPNMNPLTAALGTARPVGDGQPAPDEGESDHQQQPLKPATHTMSQEKFAKIIIDVDNRLSRAKLKDIAFLCYDKVSDKHVLEDAKSAKDIFKDMSDTGSLSKDNVGLIAELLFRVGMVKAMKEAFQGTGITYPEGQERHLNAFRCLLHDITQHLPKRKLQDVKEYCSLQAVSEDVRELEEASDFLDFFTLLEDQELIAPDNIGLVVDFSEHVFKKQKVRDFIDDYNEWMLREGEPILSVTETVKEKIFRIETWMKREGRTNLSLEEFYGHLEYEKIEKNTKKRKHDGKKEKGGADMDTTTPRNHPLSSLDGQGLPPPSRARSGGLVTPSMLTGANWGPVRNPSALGADLGSLLVPGFDDQGTASFGSMKADGGSESHSTEPTGNHQHPDVPSPLESMDEAMETAESSSDDEEFLTIAQDTFLRSIKIPYYKMDANPRGICLIISNKSFYNQDKDRVGTEKDVANLKRMFRGFDFDICLREDLTGNEMEKEFKRWQKHDHTPYNAFVCCVLSHGNKGLVFGKDEAPVELSKIIGFFKGANCPSLIGKPKVFIIQACQGESWQRLTTDQAPRSPTRGSAGIGSYFEPLPEEVDILLLMSTVPGYKSVRTPSKGSWFIMALTKIWRMFPDAEVQSVVTLVNNQLSRVTDAKDDKGVVTQTVYPSHTLRKMLFFKPMKRICDA